MTAKTKAFPSDFQWGVATSAFQLEGSPHADWTNWDAILRENPAITDHYSLYKEDLALLKHLGVNAYRFSIEWSRIQPHENAWDHEAVAHYQEIIDILRSYGIEPMVTLHHFTNPLWFTAKYPWHEDGSIVKFTGYVERLVAELTGVKYWLTFNEPYVILLGGYLEGCTPPGLRDAAKALAALKNIFTCHGRAYDIIHDRDADAQVSIAHNMSVFAPWKKWNPFDRILKKTANFFYNHSIINAFQTGVFVVKFPFTRAVEIAVPIKGKLDFFGVNYYTRIHLRFNPFKKMGVELRHLDLDGHGLTNIGWEVHPRGLEKVLRYASRLNLPLIITENGIATHDAQRKADYMKRHVDVVERCLRNGIDVRGYYYWTLIDNYEWLQGLDARFGLYRVDFNTLKRIPTPAANYYSYLISSRSQL
ncbi:MAG: glycoside hydrolase family 1 protein [Nitrospirae bacterium]|nr:glycoside hydrolase family 1 protein [Nitrospirota bacterium]NTW67232.1 glycoside hydrolase family 1 protein [Nitrospirota bacterium]